jgi:hypothetical protein
MDMEQRIRDQFSKHIVTCLIDNEEIEAWRFKKPDSSDCQMDIFVTRYGMAMVGDFGDITFRVGRSYGIPFLTHQSKGYVLEKMDQNCKQYELDKEDLLQHAFEESKEYILDSVSDYIVRNSVEETTNLSELMAALETIQNTMDGYPYVIDDVLEFIEGVDLLEDLEEAYNFLYTVEWLEDVFEWDIKKLASFTESRIWALHVAAEKILEYKNERV